jgi:GMP synthase-like glutamine amidotransferase
MRLHYLQHVPFEDAANVAVWARRRGHSVTRTRLFAGEPLPRCETFDWLAVMGGPMSTRDHDAFPWLAGEKELIREAIDRRMPVLGICLGAQLAAEVLGAAVTRNREREIGWFPVWLTDSGRRSELLAALPERFLAFHWHGDTFDVPPGALHLAESEACRNQAFQYEDHVLGLQFHLDYSVESIQKMTAHCQDELVGGPFVQTAQEMLARPDRIDATQRWLDQTLDAMERPGRRVSRPRGGCSN